MQAIRELIEIPVRHRGLSVPGVATAAVGVITNMLGIKAIHKTIRAVVKGEPQNRHVVCVHHAMTKAHNLPTCHERRRAPHDCTQQLHVRLVVFGRSGITCGAVLTYGTGITYSARIT